MDDSALYIQWIDRVVSIETDRTRCTTLGPGDILIEYQIDPNGLHGLLSSLGDRRPVGFCFREEISALCKSNKNATTTVLHLPAPSCHLDLASWILGRDITPPPYALA